MTTNLQEAVKEGFDHVETKLSAKYDSLKTQLEDSVRELAQKQTSGSGYMSNGTVSKKSIGEQACTEILAKSELIKSGGAMSLNVKAEPSFIGSDSGSSIENAGLGRGGLTPNLFQNALSLSTTTDASIRYSRFNQDGEVVNGSVIQKLEGDLKGELIVDLKQINVDVAQFAVWSSVSFQLINDQNVIGSILDVAHRRRLNLAIDSAIVNGYESSVGNANFDGYKKLAKEFVRPGTDLIDSISFATEELLQQGYNPTNVVLNPATATALRIARDRNDRPQLSWFGDGRGESLRGLNIITSPSVGFNEAYIIDPVHNELKMRDELTVQMYAAGDDVKRNLRTLLSEVRMVPLCYSTNSVVRVVTTENVKTK